jgi:short-subunit dehydrogenase
MRVHGRGRIMNVASTAAFQPGPFMAAYYATKAFVFSFSEALREELRGTGITVTTLCPGLTRTRFIERAGMNRMMSGLRVMSAQQVAEAGCRGMFRGKPVVIPGVHNWLLAVISRRMPVWMTSRAVRKINGF